MTTTKTPSEQADEIVEMFKKQRMEIMTRQDSIPCVMSDFPTTKSAINCAILHVTGIIEVLERLVKDSLLPSAALIKELDEQRNLLTILKNKL